MLVNILIWLFVFVPAMWIGWHLVSFGDPPLWVLVPTMMGVTIFSGALATSTMLARRRDFWLPAPPNVPPGDPPKPTLVRTKTSKAPAIHPTTPAPPAPKIEPDNERPAANKVSRRPPMGG